MITKHGASIDDYDVDDDQISTLKITDVHYTSMMEIK